MTRYCKKCNKEKNTSEYYSGENHCCKACSSKRTKEYYKKNSLERKKRRIEIYDSYRDEFFRELGGAKCISCGFSDQRALQIDHVNGFPGKSRIDRSNSLKLLQDIHDNPGKYQVLCANCNWIKKHENDENIRGLNQLNTKTVHKVKNVL